MPRDRSPVLLAAAVAAFLCLAAAPAAPAAPAASGAPAPDEDGYRLYYRLDVPPALIGLALSDQGSKNTYSGILRGTLGGVVITDAHYIYSNGASKFAGGGTFTMTTMAGPVQQGRILMTGDGKTTTLVFFGIYLGARVSFSIVGPDEQLGGSAVTATGLADTTFRSHEEYMAAVRQAAGLSDAVRSQVVAQADQNPRLVREYRERRH
jgi:hypothetical protein